jgi:hypothetical protein
MRRALAGLAAVLALVGCGGSSQPAAVPHPSDLAAKIHGCHSYAATEAALYAREQGQCTLGDGDTADIATFSTEQAARNYLAVAQGVRRRLRHRQPLDSPGRYAGRRRGSAARPRWHHPLAPDSNARR